MLPQIWQVMAFKRHINRMQTKDPHLQPVVAMLKLLATQQAAVSSQMTTKSKLTAQQNKLTRLLPWL